MFVGGTVSRDQKVTQWGHLDHPGVGWQKLIAEKVLVLVAGSKNPWSFSFTQFAGLSRLQDIHPDWMLRLHSQLKKDLGESESVKQNLPFRPRRFLFWCHVHDHWHWKVAQGIFHLLALKTHLEFMVLLKKPDSYGFKKENQTDHRFGYA